MLNFGDYRKNEKKADLEAIPAGFYECTFTKASFVEYDDRNGDHHEKINASLQIRKDVENNCKGRYVNTVIEPKFWDFDNSCPLPADKRQPLEECFAENVLPYISEDLTDKDRKDWLSICEWLVNKNVKIKISKCREDDKGYKNYTCYFYKSNPKPLPAEEAKSDEPFSDDDLPF